LKKKIHEMSLWLKISFHKEKQRWEIHILIYVKTLGESNWFVGVLAKVSQLGWWEIPTSSSSLLLVELRMIHMVNHGGSWINTILKHYKSLQDPIRNWANRFCSVFIDLDILFVVPFMVEPMFSEWT